MKDNLIFSGKWFFDDDVTLCFDDMLSRSIPGYLNMREMIELIVSDFISNGDKKILDIGSSIGGSIEPYLVNDLNNKYVCIDSSSSMMKAFQNTYRQYILDDKIVAHCVPIENYIWEDCFDVIQSVLTLQFVDPSKRQSILSSIYKHLNENGIFILVEKIVLDNQELCEFFTETYHRYKKANGYDQEQINSKKEALKTVLIPYTQTQNIQLMKEAGFKKVECFWRCLTFAGYIAMK